jgi:hypothetical protein
MMCARLLLRWAWHLAVKHSSVVSLRGPFANPHASTILIV